MVGVTSLVEMDSVNLNTFEVWALKRSLKLNTRWTDIISIRVMRQKTNLQPKYISLTFRTLS